MIYLIHLYDVCTIYRSRATSAANTLLTFEAMLGPMAADFLVDWTKLEEDAESPIGGCTVSSTGTSRIVLDEGAPPASITPAFASSAAGSCMLLLLLLRLLTLLVTTNGTRQETAVWCVVSHKPSTNSMSSYAKTSTSSPDRTPVTGQQQYLC